MCYPEPTTLEKKNDVLETGICKVGFGAISCYSCYLYKTCEKENEKRKLS